MNKSIGAERSKRLMSTLPAALPLQKSSYQLELDPCARTWPRLILVSPTRSTFCTGNAPAGVFVRIRVCSRSHSANGSFCCATSGMLPNRARERTVSRVRRNGIIHLRQAQRLTQSFEVGRGRQMRPSLLDTSVRSSLRLQPIW